MDYISDPSTIKDIQAELYSVSQLPDQREKCPYPWLQHYQEGVPAHLEIPDCPLNYER
jgi:hypothetical protein